MRTPLPPASKERHSRENDKIHTHGCGDSVPNKTMKMITTTPTVATKTCRRKRRCWCWSLLVFIHMSLQTSQAFLSSPTNPWIPMRLYAENPKERKTMHRPPYRLGVHPYLEHGHRKGVKNATSRVHEPLQEQVLEFQETMNAAVHNATTNHTMLSEGAISNATTTLVNISATTNALPLATTTTTTNASTLQKNKTKSSKTTPENNYFSTWAMDMTSKKPKEKLKAAVETTTLVSNKKGDELLTVADLEEILRAGGYVRESDLVGHSSSPLSSNNRDQDNVKLKSSGSVAMPQVSVLSYRGLTIGSTVASALLGMILSMTILPNLWLVGILFGTLYGYEVSKGYKDKPPTNVLSRIVVGMGRRLAKAYLVVYDFFHGIWFMYKTGQLSYEYYKQYSKLDDRFGIGEKMDAWNARFIEGKKKFDQWEKENEVSRRLLASLRTAWLVEQQSLKKGRRQTQSKYRIVQFVYDVTGWCGRFLAAIWHAITGGGSSDLREILKGIRIHISESRMQEIGPRMGAAVLALVTVSMIGAMFAIAPKVLGLLAIAMGVIWPTWLPEFLERFQSLLDEFKAKGRGEDFQVVSGIPTSALTQFGLYDKKRYYYYRRQDGSKRWYRTGRPAFRSDDNKVDGGLLGGIKDKTKTGKNAGKKTTKISGKQQPQKQPWNLFG